MRNYKNFELFEQVAISIMQGKRASRQIYQTIQYNGTYAEFRSALSALKRRGYLCFHDVNQLPTNPFKRKHQYAITKKGQSRLQNPSKSKRNQSQLPPLEVIHSGHESRMHEPVNDLMGNITSDNNLDDTYYDKYIDISNENTELKREIISLKKQIGSYNASKVIKINKKIAKHEQYIQNASARINISNVYDKNKSILDYQFFRAWHPYIPVSINGLNGVQSLDIISKLNNELHDSKRVGHATLISPELIPSCQMRIKSINKTSITITSDRWNFHKVLKF